MKKGTIKEVLILNSELEAAKAFKAFTDRYASFRKNFENEKWLDENIHPYI